MWPNWVDLFVILIPVLRACYVGFSSGLVSGLLNLLGVVGVTVLACNARTIVAQWLAPWWRFDPMWVEYVCFMVLLLTGILLVHWLLRKLSTILQWERMHWFIQGLGLVVGGMRGLWWAGLWVLILQSFGIPYLQDSVQKRSLLGPQLSRLAQERIAWVADWFPGHGARGASLVPQVVINIPQLPSIYDSPGGTPGSSQKKSRR